MARELFFAPCPRGLESVLTDELRSLGAEAIDPSDGGVGFAGEYTLAYRANLESRIASRVLWRVARGSYRNEHELHELARGLPWQRWFAAERTLRVNVSATHSPLKSLEFATLRIKDGICDRFREQTGSRPSIDKARADVRVHAYLTAQECTFYLDTSGAPLFQRGYRRAIVEAPLRENLAAGILRLVGWNACVPLLDPMCGGGTFLIEAAHMALGIPPGKDRAFAFEHLSWFDTGLWTRIYDEVAAAAKPATRLAIFGSDNAETAIDAARKNLRAAGLSSAVTLECCDAIERLAPADTGMLVTNLPYGVKMSNEAELGDLYPRLGDALKRHFAGWSVYLLSADTRLPRLIGLKTSRRTPLFNGALECRLYGYSMVAGSARKTKAAAQ